jgi:hypothetical protein
VVVELSQVTADWMESTEVWTSAGRATEPITKQAVAREVRGAIGKNVRFASCGERRESGTRGGGHGMRYLRELE